MGKKKTSGGDMGSDAQEGGGLLRPQAFEVAELLKDPANVRKHSDRNVEAIAASLRRFGQQKPIVVDMSGVVRAGNGTLEAAQRLGWEKIVGVVTDLKGGDATAYAIADNRTAELAEWDDDALQAQLLGLMDEDQELAFAAGFDEDELEKLLHEVEFFPTSEDEQTPLDTKSPNVCPKCGHEF